MVCACGGASGEAISQQQAMLLVGPHTSHLTHPPTHYMCRVPEFVKEKRFHNWLKDARDWAISRNR